MGFFPKQWLRAQNGTANLRKNKGFSISSTNPGHIWHDKRWPYCIAYTIYQYFSGLILIFFENLISFILYPEVISIQKKLGVFLDCHIYYHPELGDTLNNDVILCLNKNAYK